MNPDGLLTREKILAARRIGLAFVLAASGLDALACDPSAGYIAAAEGVVEVRSGRTGPWRPTQARQALCPGDQVTVRGLGRAAVVLTQDVLVRLDQNTTLTLPTAPTQADAELGLSEGVVHVISRFRKRFGILTPVVNALVDGTEFTVAGDSAHARVAVAEGRVRAVNARGEQALLAGEAADTTAGSAPGPVLVVQPLETVRWAIHYPQVVLPDAASVAGLPEPSRKAVLAARDAAIAGHFRAALDALPASMGENSPMLAAFRAGLFLGLGRVDQAEAVLSALPPGADAAADAVRTVLLTARNDPAGAQDAAGQAIQRDPAAQAAWLALSYARQAGGRLNDALDAATQATQRAPDNPLAWARRAELELALARPDAAERSIRRALELNPDTAHAQTFAAFALLLRGRDTEAASAFETTLDGPASADPLAHFGRGLTHLRQGQLDAARREIEIAVLLDPSNAELRSYLGRAYMDEARDKQATDQFALARRLDPASPTPWYFDAFRKLQGRDFVGAINDGETAMALNDNRVVLRGGALIDQDRAARSASLGDAYREAGFYGPMQARAMSALDDDPQSPAAHRLLADAYTDTPRYETARLSELLQSQLRQPIGQMPLPPQLVMPALPVLDGPRGISPDEGSSLFARRPTHFAASLMGGNQGTFAGSVLASQAAERVQITAGAFDYRSRALVDGGVDTHLSGTRLTGQFALTPASMLIAELRHTERTSGEQSLGLFDSEERRRRDAINTDLGRLALRYAPSASEEVLLDAVTLHVRERTGSLQSLLFPTGDLLDVGVDADNRVNARRFAGLYSWQGEGKSVTAGASSFRLTGDQAPVVTTCCVFGPDPLVDTQPANRLRTDRDAVFAYAKWRAASVLTLHGGLEYVRLADAVSAGTERINGKIGAVVDATPSTTLRAAVFQGVKGSKYDRESLEPTQFAGFNQVFDDFDGTRWTRAAMAVDQRFAGNVKAGAEISARRLDVPTLGCDTPDCLARWKESQHRLYAAMPFGQRAALSAEWRHEATHLEGSPANLTSMPYRLRTDLVPIRLWLRVGPGDVMLENWLVRQHARLADAFGGEDAIGQSTFSVTNLRYTLPLVSNHATVSVGASNLFDRNFRFENADYNGDPKAPLFFPRRTVLVQFKLHY